MRIVFMGTPEFAASILEAALRLNQEVVGVYTQPDKPQGRRAILTPPPAKVLALEKGLPVFQPRRVKTAAAVEELRSLRPDLILVAAYGQILSQTILDIPAFGCVCIHASLLPKYRGAAPIQWAIANGETVTGVTAMQMETGIDTGDMILKKEVPIAGEDTSGTLHIKLADAGARLTEEILEILAKNGSLPREAQREEEATYAPILTKEDGRIDWTMTAKQIADRIRGFTPWPSCYTYLKGQKLAIWKASAVDCNKQGEPGRVLESPRRTLWVQTGQGVLAVEQLQLQGKKMMPADAFLLGNRIEGEILHGE